MTNRWLILAVLFLARTAMGYQFQSVGAVSPVLVPALEIDYALLGTLIGLYMLPGVVVAFPSGILIQRFGEKPIAVLGLALMTVGGIVMAAADGFAGAASGRLLTGVGAVLLNVVLAKMVIDWFADREIVLAMAILLASWPLGIGLALVSLGGLAAAESLAMAMLAPAVACAACGGLLWATYRAPPAPPPDDAVLGAAGASGRITGREIWLVSLAGAIWMAYNAGYIIVLSFAPDLLTTRGVSVAAAGALVSLVTWAIVLVLPFAGFAAGRIDRPTAVMAMSFAAATATIIAIPYLDSPVTLFVLMGLVFAPPAGIIMALPGQVLRLRSRAVGTGIFFTWYYAGMAALPVAAGYARDATGDAAAPILFGGLVMAATIPALAALRVSQRGGRAVR